MSLSSNIRAGAAYVEVTAETSKLHRNLTAAQVQLQSFGKSCTAIGKDILMLSGAMAAPLALSLKSFAGFDDQMRLVQAVTQATEADLRSLTKTGQRLGRDTSYTAQQAAEAMVALGRMGFAPAEIQASIDAVLNLARATGTELADAGNIAANAMRIFGIEASKMTDVSDILTVATNSSAQTLTDLFEGLKMGGPQAKAAGESIQETAASLAVLANMGIKGSLAGTALRKSFSQFTKVKVQDQLRAVGVETVDANGNLRKMADIMRDVGKVMSTMPSAEKLAFAEDIFDIRGSLAGLTLGANTDQLDAMLAKLRDVEGVAAKTAGAMDAGLGGSFRLLLSAIEGVMNATAEALTGTLQPLIDKITAIINAITLWVEANVGLVTAFAIAVAGAAGLGVALIAIGLAAKGAAAGIAVVQTTLKGFAFIQGLCVAQGTTLGNSLSLLTQAFVNYRNAAIPAMVGTSQLLAALNLPIDVRSKQIAAGLVLMSNAEAAAAGKSMLAAKWQAAISALRSFSLSTVAASVTTQAHSAVLGVSALATKALAGARAFAATVTGLFSAANLKATATAVAGGAANLFLAVATKAVAAGYLAASAAAAVFCAIPISWILIGVGAALAVVVYGLSRAGKYTAELSDKMETLRQKGDDQRRTDQMRMERLKQLSEKQKLTNAEMAEAESLTGKLSAKYGDFGASVDTVAGNLTLAADAQDKLNEAMKRSALAELDAEIAEYEANLKELRKEDEALMSYWNHNLWSRVTGKQEDAVKQLEANGDRAIAYRNKIGSARQRKKALEGGDSNALTGEGEQTDENIQAETQRRAGNAQAAADAETRVAQIDAQLAKERRSELESEIVEIQNLNEEYKKLIQTMLDFERSKADALQDKEKIAELEKKLAAADAIAAERIAKAQDKAAEKFNRDVANLERRFAETERDIQQRREERDVDRELDRTMKNDPAAGIAMLNDMIEQYRMAAAEAKARFQEELKSAKADGVIDDEERQRINEAQEGYTRAESMLDKYEDKLHDAQEGTGEAAEREGTLGSFFSEALDAMLGGGTEAERTAAATELVAKQGKDTNKYLRRIAENSLNYT